jgi:hypothetical protein
MPHKRQKTKTKDEGNGCTLLLKPEVKPLKMESLKKKVASTAPKTP